jgi:ABC-type bacteriocin/lantibiotic exporter with double-glycine peptidase domain
MHFCLRRFASDFLQPHWLVFVWTAALSFIGIIAPILSITVIDRAIPRHDDFQLHWKTTVIFIGVVVLRQVVLLVSETITLRIKEQIIQDIQNSSILHIRHMPLSFFSDKQSSYLQCRVMADAPALYP